MNFQRWEVISVLWSSLYLWSSQNLWYLFPQRWGISRTSQDQMGRLHHMIWFLGLHLQEAMVMVQIGITHWKSRTTSWNLSLDPSMIVLLCIRHCIRCRYFRTVDQSTENKTTVSDIDMSNLFMNGMGFKSILFSYFCSLDWGSHFCLTLVYTKGIGLKTVKSPSDWRLCLELKSSSASNAFSWAKVLLFCSVAVGQSIFWALNKWALYCKLKEFLQN